MKKVLLYSGGMDSWLADELWEPDERLYVDIGCPYQSCELSRLDPEKPVRVVKLDLAAYERQDSHRIVPMRNLYFAMTAANEYPDGDLQICLAATQGDRRNHDKNLTFAGMATDMLSYLFGRQSWTEGRSVELAMPFADATKSEMLGEFKARGGDLGEAYRRTFSCFNPGPAGEPCMGCMPCFRKAVAFCVNGFEFDRGDEERLLAYHDAEIAPVWEAWSTGRGRESDDVRRAVAVWRADA